MQTFRDRNGVEWVIDIHVGAVKALRAAGVDIMSEDGKGIVSLGDDPVLLAESLYALCRKQAEERGVTEEAFYAALSGDAIESAVDAMLKAVTDFFPPSRRRVLEKALGKSRELEAAMTAEAERRVDEIDVTALLSAMSSPVLSESIPDA